MFSILEKTCPRCGGCLTDEWKLDLPKERELVCINCGKRDWERLKKRGRPRKRTEMEIINLDNYRKAILLRDRKFLLVTAKEAKWRRSRIDRDIKESFDSETRRQILKHQSSNKKSAGRKPKKNIPGLSSRWLQV